MYDLAKIAKLNGNDAGAWERANRGQIGDRPRFMFFSSTEETICLETKCYNEK